MILERIRVHPFAGTPDRTVDFAPRLNVVVGPNEAGKSTLVNALRSALFRSTQLTPAKFRDEMQPYVPVTGGDTIRVTLVFTVGGRAYTLEKCWGASKSSRLCLPGGGDLTGTDRVEAELARLLQFGEGTYRYVLITYQSHLAGTVDDLQKNPLESTATLTSLLQRSIFQSDGVSVDRLKALALQKDEEYFGRWDRDKNAPEKGRDFDNPWGKGAGTIVRAYYAMRKADEQLKEADLYEKRIDEFAATTRTLQEELSNLLQYVDANAPFVADARRRAELALKLDQVNREIPDLREAQQQWPRCEEQLQRLKTEVEALREEYKKLKAEQEQSVELQKQQTLRDTFAKAQREQERLQEEEHRLGVLPGLSDQALKTMREAEQNLNALKIKLESQKLAVRITASTPLDVTLRTPAGEREIRVATGQDFSEVVKGRLELSHPDWSLVVRPATEDMDALEKAFDEGAARLTELRKSAGVKSLEEAAAMVKAYEEQKARVNSARASLQAVLGKETYEGLRQRLSALPHSESARSVSTLSELIRQVSAEGGEKATEVKGLEKQCAAWTAKYKDHDALLDLLVRKKQESSDLERQMQALAPLPAGVADPAAYVQKFDTIKDTAANKKEGLSELLLERKEFEKNAPDETLEDLREKARDLRAAFQTALAQGEAYAKIRKELAGLLELLDTNTYTPLQKRFEDLVGRLTLSRYTGLQMEGPLPVRIKAPDRAFTLDMLSQGTLDILALAVRLGMAEYYLDETDGFVVMDDPLVNLDPDRQRAAVRCIQDFARQKQTIVLTCHPAHASLLGGNVVVL